MDLSTLTIGPDTPYRLLNFSPDPAPDVGSADTPNSVGESAGMDVDRGRTFAASIGFEAHGNPSQVRADRAVLVSFFQTSQEDIMLEWIIGGVYHMRWVRARGIDTRIDGQKRLYTVCDIRWRASDPLTYGEATDTTIDDATTVSTGGTRPTSEWLFVVHGPCTGLHFSAQTANGRIFQINSPGVSLATGDRWEIEGRTGDVRWWDADGLDPITNDPTGSYYWNIEVTAAAGYKPLVLPLKADECDVTFTRQSGSVTTGTLTTRPGLY